MVNFCFCCDIYGYNVYGRCCDTYGSLRHLWEAFGHLWEFVIFMGVVTFMGQTEAVISSLINPLINDTVALFSFLCIAMKAEKSIVHLFCLFFKEKGDD